MDKQIEELANDLQEAWTAWGLSADLPKPWAYVAEILAKKWQPKIPENAVVLTEDNAEEIGNIIVESPQMQATMKKLIKEWRKEMAEKFVERLKERFNPYYIEGLNEAIDETAKEITEGENGEG